MEGTVSLDDVALFLAVADGGGLAAAARATGTSPPTLSRRMTVLESRTGRRLFERGARGYSLTSDGRAFLDACRPLRAAAHQVARFVASPIKLPRVRITAGAWTSRHLARRIGAHWTPGDGWLPEFVSATQRIDIARRDADIGIRNARPDQSWLAGQRTGTVEYAIFGRDPGVGGFVVLTGEPGETPSNRWLRDKFRAEIVTRANDGRVALDLALAGIARIVLPLFAGDPEPGLQRLSDPIAELTHEEWLVSHHDGRHDPPVRAALDAVRAILTAPEN